MGDFGEGYSRTVNTWKPRFTCGWGCPCSFQIWHYTSNVKCELRVAKYRQLSMSSEEAPWQAWFKTALKLKVFCLRTRWMAWWPSRSQVLHLVFQAASHGGMRHHLPVCLASRYILIITGFMVGVAQCAGMMGVVFSRRLSASCLGKCEASLYIAHATTTNIYCI